MRAGLTRKQRECLDFIRSYFAENLISPSFDEIMTGLGLRSKAGVHRLVHALQERGLIKFMDNRARSILPIGMEHLQEPQEGCFLQVSVDPLIQPALKVAAGNLGIPAQQLANKILREALL